MKESNECQGGNCTEGENKSNKKNTKEEEKEDSKKKWLENCNFLIESHELK